MHIYFVCVRVYARACVIIAHTNIHVWTDKGTIHSRIPQDTSNTSACKFAEPKDNGNLQTVHQRTGKYNLSWEPSGSVHISCTSHACHMYVTCTYTGLCLRIVSSLCDQSISCPQQFLESATSQSTCTVHIPRMYVVEYTCTSTGLQETSARTFKTCPLQDRYTVIQKTARYTGAQKTGTLVHRRQVHWCIEDRYTVAQKTDTLVHRRQVHWCTEDRYTGAQKTGTLVHRRQVHWYTEDRYTGAQKTGTLVHRRQIHWCTEDRYTGAQKTGTLVHRRQVHWCTEDRYTGTQKTGTLVHRRQIHWCTEDRYTGTQKTGTLVHRRQVHWCTEDRYTGTQKTGTLVHRRQVHWCTEDRYTGAQKTGTLVHRRQVHWCTEDRYIGAQKTGTLAHRRQVHYAHLGAAASVRSKGVPVKWSSPPTPFQLILFTCGQFRSSRLATLACMCTQTRSLTPPPPPPQQGPVDSAQAKRKQTVLLTLICLLSSTFPSSFTVDTNLLRSTARTHVFPHSMNSRTALYMNMYWSWA